VGCPGNANCPRRFGKRRTSAASCIETWKPANIAITAKGRAEDNWIFGFGGCCCGQRPKGRPLTLTDSQAASRPHCRTCRRSSSEGEPADGGAADIYYNWRLCSTRWPPDGGHTPEEQNFAAHRWRFLHQTAGRPGAHLTRAYPPNLRPLSWKCLDKAPDRRYQSATGTSRGISGGCVALFRVHAAASTKYPGLGAGLRS